MPFGRTVPGGHRCARRGVVVLNNSGHGGLAGAKVTRATGSEHQSTTKVDLAAFTALAMKR